jgi:23S rRNA (adenine2030-N6)-methyltransferase
VLIDPPYEVKSDYARVASCLAAAYARWPSGAYAIWYPRLGVQRDQSEPLLRRLLTSVPELLVAELRLGPQSDDFGMHGSGMAFVNPPWQFEERLRGLLPRLAGILATTAERTTGTGQPGWHLEWRGRTA